MATQIKKTVLGPMTTSPEAVPGVRFVFADGDSFEIDTAQLGVTEKQLRALPPVFVRLAVHGLAQKVGDSYASASEAENPSIYAKDAIRETIGQLTQKNEDGSIGVWRVTGGGGIRVSLLARALARATGQTVEAAQGVIDVNSQLDDNGKASDAGKAWLKALKANEAIKVATAAIKLEDAEKAKAALQAQAGKQVDVGDLGTLFQS